MDTKPEPVTDSAIILLAGENSRFWPLGRSRHKALYEVGLGEPVLKYVLLECQKAGIRRVILVRRPQDRGLEMFLENVNIPSLELQTVVQNEPLGMADAVLTAAPHITGDYFFVLDGNQVFFSLIAERMRSIKRPFFGLIAVKETKRPEKFGIAFLSKEQNIVQAVAEKPKGLSMPQWRILASYYLHKSFLSYLERFKNSVFSGFELALDQYVKDRPVVFVPLNDHEDITLKYPWDLLRLHSVTLDRISAPGVVIHPTAYVHPTAVIEGDVYIHAGSRIMEYASIKGRTVVGSNSVIGSFGLVRDSLLCEGVVVGAHSEVVRSILYKGVHLHRNYVGDSVLDAGSSLGAGTIIGNRRHDRKNITSAVKGEKVLTGISSLGAIIGESVKIGINCSLRPGVKIGRGSMVSESSVVKYDLDEKVLLKLDGTLIRP